MKPIDLSKLKTYPSFRMGHLPSGLLTKKSNKLIQLLKTGEQMKNQDEDEQKFVEVETSILEDLKREIAELEERVKELEKKED